MRVCVPARDKNSEVQPLPNKLGGVNAIVFGFGWCICIHEEGLINSGAVRLDVPATVA